jgi:hypothetical protein
MGQLGSRDVPRFCAVPCTFPSLAASPEAQDNLRRISPRCEVVSPRPPIAPSPRLLQCAAHGRPGAVAPCERGRLPALRAASCELHAQHNSLTTRPKNAPPSFNEGMHSRAGLAHWQARPLAVSSRSWQCALCDVLMCCWMAWELTCKITASLAKCRFCPCYPLPR